MERRLRFSDLVAAGVVNNRVTLGSWIRKRGFPPGRMIGPNSRSWGEREVQSWLDSRPTAPKPTPALKGRRGRPRLAATTTTTTDTT